MNFNAFFFIERLYGVTEELRYVDGQEQVCLVIPTVPNQIYKGRTGGWYMQLFIHSTEMNEKGRSHFLRLQFRDMDGVRKAKREGWFNQVNNLGNVYPNIVLPKIDWTNRSQKIELHGYLNLSDIPAQLIRTERANNKKYLQNVKIMDPSDANIIYVGSICLTDIMPKFRYRDSNSGKYFTKVIFKTSDRLDYGMNTHLIYATDNNGSMIEIGRLREWRKDQPVPVEKRENPQAPPNPTAQNNQRPPRSIDGMKF